MDESVIGQYKIVREAGKGGMGIIYKAMDPRTQKAVAIKVLPPMMVDKVTVERFRREIQAMIKLKHPNMIDVLDFGMERGKHFMVMEFVEGENLKVRVKRQGPLPIHDSLVITAQIADALLYMHKQGMIHRDIKPSNVMITPEGKVKVMDYGLVKIMGITSVTVDGTSLGTAEYMSPEQITGEGVDSRTDIYSLGVTLYEMLSGRLPFEGDTIQALLHKHQTEVPVSLRSLRPEIPAELEWIVTKAMAKDIAHRYQTMDALLEDLHKFSPGMPEAGTEASETARPSAAGPSRTELLSPRASGGGRSPSRAGAGSGYPRAGIFLLGGALLLAGGVFYRHKVAAFFEGRHLPSWHGNSNLMSEAASSLKTLEEADAHFIQAQENARRGDAGRAVQEYRRAIQLREDYPGYYRELAALYEQQNEYKNAVKVWADLLKFLNDPVEVRGVQQHIEQLTQTLSRDQ